MEREPVIRQEVQMLMTFRRSASAHPYRVATIAAFVIAAAGLGWYLGSPLFLRSYANEALPIAAVAPVVAAPAVNAAATAVAVAPAAAVPVAAPRDLAKGELQYVDSIHNGKGEVRLVEIGASRFLRFESVAISNAPDIHVYLSKDVGGRYVEATSLYLGALKVTNGSFNYELPAGTDLAQFKSVVLWCRNFSTLITWADLH